MWWFVGVNALYLHRLLLLVALVGIVGYNGGMKCNLDGETETTESGIRVMPVDSKTQTAVHVVLPLPVCCPVSGNPLKGSVITFSYIPRGKVVETYSLSSVISLFKGGFTGVGRYKAERNMEGMVSLLCQMVSDAVGVRVRCRAKLILDTGEMVVTTSHKPGG